jgi:glutamine amidotransferase-like uncharacterized protein
VFTGIFISPFANDIIELVKEIFCLLRLRPIDQNTVTVAGEITMNRLRLPAVILFAAALVALSVFAIHAAINNGTPPAPSLPAEPGPDEPVAVEPEKPESLDCTVGLYTGQGSWDPDLVAMRNFLAEYNLTCLEIDQETVSNDDLNTLCDILVLVGGASSEYLNYINNHANIRSFVENGGSFVGFCAGAYYASSTMRWEGNLYDYPLGLFPGEAAGPYFQWGSLATIDLNPKISFNQDFPDTLEMWYFGGPCFTGFSESDVDILARYHANGEAAVIAFNLGSGRVLLSGPHPELGYNPAAERIETEGNSGAQWPWLYAALQWLINRSKI